MRKIITIFLLAFATMLYTSLVNAQPGPQRPVLDKVVLQVSAEKWVTTKTAKVIVRINATLNKTGLANVRNTMMANLNKIAVGSWHITQFNRSQSSSGLETLSVQADARLDESKLTNLRSAAKSVSKPGETYRIANIDFTPSLADVQTVREQVRQQLYQTIKAEVARVNQTYPDANYSVNWINFISSAVPQRTYKRARVAEMNAMAVPASAGISVSNKVQMTASVVLAANRKQ